LHKTPTERLKPLVRASSTDRPGDLIRERNNFCHSTLKFRELIVRMPLVA
jgi:hypothetical protein